MRIPRWFDAAQSPDHDFLPLSLDRGVGFRLLIDAVFHSFFFKVLLDHAFASGPRERSRVVCGLHGRPKVNPCSETDHQGPRSYFRRSAVAKTCLPQERGRERHARVLSVSVLFAPACANVVLIAVHNRLPADRGYLDLNRNMSVSSMPVTHGLTKTGSVYESAAYFLRNNTTERELLFFGDVEPDSISSKPQTINVWKAAAPKIPHTLASVFIECSWTSDRPDNLLFGHLNPVHLVDELVTLALEVYKVKNNLQSASMVITEGKTGPDTWARKKKKPNPIPLESLRGVLDGVTAYIMHCKSDVGGQYDGPISQVIGAEVRALAEKKGLGVEIVVLEQGTRIREFCP